MEIFNKVNSQQLYLLWRNFTITIITIVIVLSSMKILPVIFAPFISLIGASFLYLYIIIIKRKANSQCMIIPYTMMYVMMGFSLILIVLNVLFAFNIINIKEEFLYYNRPFIPILYLGPISSIIILIIFLRRKKLQICKNCRMQFGNKFERGEIGNIYDYESHLQLKNAFSIFSLITILTWFYYIFLYNGTSVNERDSYVFTWITVIVFIIDEIFFALRYYNIYILLKEQNRIITPNEIDDMSSKTYIRYYVICDNYLYVNKINGNSIIDTPFLSKNYANGILLNDVKSIISNLTGINNGELRFFYGRISNDSAKIRLLRYFYFIDGSIDDFKELPTRGKWINYNKILETYTTAPNKLSPIMVTDITRLATIIITEKLYDKEGNRKYIIKSYKPSFNLIDVRDSKIDFQDDKWIYISQFNSNSSFYKIRKFFRKILRKQYLSN